MKNILIISAVFPPEAVVSANLSSDLANTLCAGHETTVISPVPSRPLGFNFEGVVQPKHPFKHIVIGSFISPHSSICGRFRESFSFGKACARYIDQNHNEINTIYANTWPLLAQFYTVKAAIKFNIPVIIHVQDIYPESLGNKIPWIDNWINRILLPMDAWILRNAKVVIAISEKMKSYLLETRNIEPSHIDVVTNWQDEQPFINLANAPLHKTENAPFTFMYLGNIGPVAGLEFVVDTFQRSELRNAILVIAGSGSSKEKLMKKASPLSPAIIEFISVPEGKVPETQAMADVMILPMKKGAASTSIPSKLPAYMFSAKPIIASVDADTDTANAIREAGCGWVLEPENPAMLASLMQHIVAMPKEDLVKMGLNGRSYALQYFSKQANLSKLVSIIEETANA